MFGKIYCDLAQIMYELFFFIRDLFGNSLQSPISRNKHRFLFITCLVAVTAKLAQIMQKKNKQKKNASKYRFALACPIHYNSRTLFFCWHVLFTAPALCVRVVPYMLEWFVSSKTFPFVFVFSSLATSNILFKN